MYLNLKNNNIEKITAQSLEADNTETPGFSFQKIITHNGDLIISNIALEATGASVNTEQYISNYLVRSVDSSPNETTTVNYQYNNGNINFIRTETDDTSMNMHNPELHKWYYSSNAPDSMLRIKDSTDTTVVHFIKDERQNITEETWLKKNRTIEHYYYYYDDKDRLTDIVRFNLRAQQMLPDYVFEYNADGTISQMTEIPQGSSNYVIWAYIYDERGLKSKDILYSKNHELLGSVTYTFQ